jgi:hypothetical protein
VLYFEIPILDLSLMTIYHLINDFLDSMYTSTICQQFLKIYFWLYSETVYHFKDNYIANTNAEIIEIFILLIFLTFLIITIFQLYERTASRYKTRRELSLTLVKLKRRELIAKR